MADARTIFQYAEAFSDASERLHEQFSRRAEGVASIPIADAAHVAPCATLDSFALELYLKCLHVIEHGKRPRGHDCKKLFEGLPEGTQQAIRFQYNTEHATSPIVELLAKEHPRLPMGFDPCLELSSKVFEKVRYLYEGTGDEFFFYWPMLRHAVRRTILAINPGWITPPAEVI